MSVGRKLFKWAALICICFILLLFMTKPSKAKFDEWIDKKYDIHCDIDQYQPVCYMADRKIESRSSHFLNSGIYAIYRIHFNFEDGEALTVRTLGVLGMLTTMNEGMFWKILEQ